MFHARRYLVQFSPKHTPHLFTDILVIGACNSRRNYGAVLR
jgi:hypothetical protein